MILLPKQQLQKSEPQQPKLKPNRNKKVLSLDGGSQRDERLFCWPL
jgi:hypothetical protein